VTLILESTEMTKLMGVEQLRRLTCVKVITVPTGHEVHPALILPGPILAKPEALNTKLPVAPVAVDHDKLALAVPVKLMVALDPGQREVEDVNVAVGRGFTVTTLEVVTAVVQGAAPALITFTNAKVVFAVSAAELIVAVPPAPITTV
jgi:hypothetical protein